MIRKTGESAFWVKDIEARVAPHLGVTSDRIGLTCIEIDENGIVIVKGEFSRSDNHTMVSFEIRGPFDKPERYYNEPR